MYGIASCPREETFFRIPDHELSKFSSYVRKRVISSSSPSNDLQQKSVKKLLEGIAASEYGMLDGEIVRNVLSFVKSN